MPDLAAPILVVEDDPDVRHMLEDALMGAGFDVRSAAHGAEALRVLRSRAVSAVVLDLMLPWVNGIEVLSTMRSDQRSAQIPVLVVTATGTGPEDLRAFRPVTIMAKPVDVDLVIQTVRRLIRARSPDERC